MEKLSRRDFLKLSASGVLGLALSEMGFFNARAAPPAAFGRVTWSGIPYYDAPSFDAKKLNLFGMDQVVPLIAEVDGDEGNPFNKTWYQLAEGFTYSGWLQPVENKLNKPVYEIRSEGRLGEITVPFSDTRLTPYLYGKKGYRLYYGSTHWVKKTVVIRDEKNIWYEIYDRHLKKSFYVPSHHMRIIPDDELTLLSPGIPNAEKMIHVDLETQWVTAFESDVMVFSSRCSSGGKGTRTPAGEFLSYHKGASVHMTNQGDAVNNIYDLPGVPWCTFFTGYGHAFHGTYWHNDYGRPRSHGCINLKSEDAKWIYRWTSPNVPPGTEYLHLPGVGTRVTVVQANS